MSLHPSDILVSFDVVSLLIIVAVKEMLSRPISNGTTSSTKNDGVSMRNSVIPLIANYYMEAFEETAQVQPQVN